MKIDAFAHILTPDFYQTMLKIDATIPQKYPFIKIETLVDLNQRMANWPDKNTKQVISFANINPEDFVDGKKASQIAQEANQELSTIVASYPDIPKKILDYYLAFDYQKRDVAIKEDAIQLLSIKLVQIQDQQCFYLNDE